ncbi:MAG TPA: hypothetical protein VHG28_07170 [Longimicrobiaceae bacterium]|nr:hypothetical protein [Longimicrobiaceae bacterium]
MTQELESLRPVQGADRTVRRRLTVRGGLVLALLPTATVLTVGMTAVLVVMERAAVWILARYTPRSRPS